MPTAAMSRLAVFALCAAFASVAPVAAAESYPSKAIRIIVTGTPGGPPDLLARWLAERSAQQDADPTTTSSQTRD